MNIYCSGECRDVSNIGGWGVLVCHIGYHEVPSKLVRPQEHIEDHWELSGYEVNANTNRRMELMAAIKALNFTNNEQYKNLPIKIFSKSEYLINGITGGIAEWLNHGWKTASGDVVCNKDLWEKLNDLSKLLYDVTWILVKDHNQGNQIADRLAVNAIESFERNMRDRFHVNNHVTPNKGEEMKLLKRIRNPISCSVRSVTGTLNL